MGFITHWVMNIILFVLLAIIIDLLLPNSSIQRYTKMVMGLLLIVIILNPIMKLFDSDIEDILSTIKLPTVQEKNNVENLIENKKKEIQASQRAYILEQMAVQMKTIVEEELMDHYGLEVDQVDLQFEEGKEQLSAADLQVVKVVVRSKRANSDLESIPVVKEININITKPIVHDQVDKLTDVQVFLAENWQLEKGKVKVVMEGGEM